MEQPMDPDEFDTYMDGLTIRERNSVLGVEIDVHREGGPPGDRAIAKVRRIVLRLIWLIAWAWQLFTFAFPALLIIKYLDNEFKKEKK